MSKTISLASRDRRSARRRRDDADRLLHRFVQVDMANARIDLRSATRGCLSMDELTHRVRSGWLRERHERWPRTRNPHLLLSRQTAAD
ncbi:hypothetical protein [Streptomyces cellostaticus]|uniref:hypothetical protein n=1 Tax=Streptomyces cellostaticus TaxID=67285 RepID=UPI00295EA157|nr:hypothetical protein [Streptomyces cellostaticus]